MTLPLGLGPSDVALTSDDWYTPRWLFDAAGLVFDLDVCAPVDPQYRTCPARSFLTVVEDGLTQPWYGTVWLNPPYAAQHAWIERFIRHPSGLALVMATPRNTWRGPLMLAADATAWLDVEFHRPDGSTAMIRWPELIVARGDECVEAVRRVALADQYAAGAYHVRPASGQSSPVAVTESAAPTAPELRQGLKRSGTCERS